MRTDPFRNLTTSPTGQSGYEPIAVDVQMAQTAAFWDLGSSADPPRRHDFLINGSRKMSSPTERGSPADFGSPRRGGRTALVQICTGLHDRSGYRRFIGSVSETVRRAESLRAAKPRLQISHSFGWPQDPDRISGMAGQCARSQARHHVGLDLRGEIRGVGPQRARIRIAGRDVPLRVLQLCRRAAGGRPLGRGQPRGAFVETISRQGKRKAFLSSDTIEFRP